MNTPAADIVRAYALLKQKRFTDAELVCRHALERAPRHAETLHLLGLVRKEIGDSADGERLIRESIGLEPARAEFHVNLGNLLSRARRLEEAQSSYRAALSLDARHRLARLGLARTLNGLREHAAAEAQCRTLIAMNGRDSHAWSTLAVALREQHRYIDAETAYRKAIALEPDYAVAHHNLGALLSQMDRAEEALAELDRARQLGVNVREISLNRGHALLKLYRFEEAEQAYIAAVMHEPRDVDAQLSLARLRYMQGDPKFARDMVAAAANHRDAVSLQLTFGDVLRRVGDLNGAEVVLRDLIARAGPQPELRGALSAVLREGGRLKEAETEALEAAIERPCQASIIENLVSIQLLLGRAEEAAPFIRTQRTRDPHDQRWIAYEATAARLMGDALYRELYNYQDFVRSYDLDPPAGWRSMADLNAALEQVLAGRHRFPMHPFDQSLRNGSQTARSLLADSDPVLQDILRAFKAPLADYAQLIGTSTAHPLTARNRGEPVIDKCWSVQLRRDGFHVNHIHPEGWISSAYYVAVPEKVEDATLKRGWLKFGETPMRLPGDGPEHFVQPRAGRLVLFPSYMWHGTIPIQSDMPRTTIAFDAVPTAGR